MKLMEMIPILKHAPFKIVKCTWAIEICMLHSVAKPFRKRITLDKRVLQCPQKAQPLCQIFQ